jgi:hypothetical protein
MPRVQKGSPEAKAWGDKMKQLRKRGGATNLKPEEPITNEKETDTTPPPPSTSPRRIKFTKGSQEAKEHMAKLRAMKKK